ncbi:MAG: HEAT repeat domain-containing protein [Bdellovibrionota bacterium]
MRLLFRPAHLSLSSKRAVFSLSMAILLTQTGCVVLLPFVEPHEEAETHSNWSATPTSPPSRTAQHGTGNRWLNYYLKQLDDPRPTKRTAAASYLGLMGDAAEPAVPALAERLTDESKFVRRAAAKALGKIGTGASAAAPALERATKDKDEYVAQSAKWALPRVKAY